MCGIAGITPVAGGEPADRERLEAMCDRLAHRGPDQARCEIRDGVGLGIRRLSIIDLETGDQPLYSEDRSVRLVFNGEIYNYRELRRELLSAGHTFSTATDGEVVAHLWEEHGTAFARRLNGMFAIALHDSRRRRFALVRDRLGIKPLFYTQVGGRLVFGSEIKALLASGLVPAELDVDGLAQFLAWEYVPAPGTLFRGIRKLGPGEMAVWDLSSGREERHRWWDLPAPASGSEHGASGLPTTAGEWEEALDAKIGECVRRQLVSDVPLGAFLSGGVDSSLVVSNMDGALAFSIGFEDPSYDESRWAAAVAEHLGLEHRLSILQPRASDHFDHLMDYMEDPIADFSIFPTYLVSELASREVKVVLTGDGGDELFAGYETFVAERAARLWRVLPAFLRHRLLAPSIGRLPPRPTKKGWVNKLKRFVEGAEHDPALQHSRWRLFAGDEAIRALLTSEALSSLQHSVGAHIEALFGRVGENRSDLDRQLYVDLKSYLVDNCLVKVDRMSMASSLEARVPLLDHELVEMAFQVPAGLKLRGTESKHILKKVAARHVPAECVYRPKEGFSMPVKQWLCDELRPLMEELLDPVRLGREGILEGRAVERIKKEHLEGRANHSHALWALMVFQDWKRRWGVT